MIHVHVFNRQGELVGPIETQQLILSDAEWQRRLTPEQFEVLRSKGTERPFCGTLLDNKQKGVYSSPAAGYPCSRRTPSSSRAPVGRVSFQPIAEGNVAQETDHSYGMVRTEIELLRAVTDTWATCSTTGHVRPA